MTLQNIKAFYKIKYKNFIKVYLAYNVTLVSEGVQYSYATFIINIIK